MATLGAATFNAGSAPTVTFNATQTPAGEVCANNRVADCNGLKTIDQATADSWDRDGSCDNGTFGAYLVCSAFKFDDGACGGLPSTWTCPSGYYHTLDGCDCNCGAWDPDCDTAGQHLLG